jgi:type II secretory pathway component PulM
MKNWFLQKNDNDQKIIVGLAIFILILLLYTFLYLPLKRNNEKLESSINDIQTEITTMKQLEPQIARFSGVKVETNPMDDSQMMSLIEQAANEVQPPIVLSNIKSQSKNKISVTLNNVAFNAAIRWLDILQTQHHISISQLSVEAEKKGLTNITALISH